MTSIQLVAMSKRKESFAWLGMLQRSVASYCTTSRNYKSRTDGLEMLGHEKSRVSVVLTAQGCGRKMIPMIIFPPCPTEIKKLNKEFNGQAFITSSPTAWMTETTMMQYVDKIIGAPMFNHRRLLIMDTYACHLCESVKKMLSKRRVDISYIPGGCTGYIQAPDVCWNKPFKDYCTEKYSEWFLTEGLQNITKQGNLRAPPRRNVVLWILEAWKDIKQTLIQKSFLCCGLTCNDNNYNEISCFKEHKSCEEGLEMLGHSIGLQDRDEGDPFSDNYQPDEHDINAADPFNNMIDEELEIDIETLSPVKGSPKKGS